MRGIAKPKRFRIEPGPLVAWTWKKSVKGNMVPVKKFIFVRHHEPLYWTLPKIDVKIPSLRRIYPTLTPNELVGQGG